MQFMKKSYKTNKKRFISGIMAIVMFISALSVTGVITYKKSNDVKAAYVTNDGKYDIPKSEGDFGTENNPFVVIEVVPNASMASFGYLVKGEEPVNVNKILSVKEDDENYKEYKKIADNLGAYVEAADSNIVLKKEFKNLLTDEELASGEFNEVDKANQYGYFERVDAGKGNYVISEEIITDTKKIGEKETYVDDPNGDWDYVYKYTEKNREYSIDTSYRDKGFNNGVYSLGRVSQGYYFYNNYNNYNYYYRNNYNNTYYQLKFKEDKKNGKRSSGYKRTDEIWHVGNGLGTLRKEIEDITETTTTYKYTFKEQKGGNYIFKPMTYNECAELTDEAKKEYPYMHSYNFTSDSKINLNSSEYDVLKGYVTEQPVYVKYRKGKGYINSDLFKKFGIGLAYKGNDIKKGEDVSKYEFAGWYTEKQCVNLANENMRLHKDTTFYAKWIAKYPTDELNEAAGITDTTKMYVPNYTITFDDNIAEGDAEEMPAPITYIEEGKTLISPSAIPKYQGKIFEGWYTDKACTNKYLFSTPVKSNITLYANWTNLDEKRFTIKFNANTPNADDMNSVQNMPQDITDYCRNGRKADFTDATPINNDPTLSGYEFAGWYYNKACTKAFSFSTTLPENVETDTITVYAKWAPVNSKAYRLKLDVNKPADAVADVDSRSFNTEIEAQPSGLLKDASVISASKPMLEGNITAKVNKYIVKVITVTPDDLSGDYAENNLKLIDRANLIVFNQTVNEELVDIFKNKNLRADSFGNRDYSFDKKTLGGESKSTDLSWDATLRVFKKVAYGNDGSGKGIAPVIFDSNIIGNIKKVNAESLNYTSNDNQTITMNSTTMNLGTISNQNIFKLYLLTQQMNPVTFYNAYINGGSETAKIGGENNNGKGLFTVNKKSIAAWSFKTLFPIEAITNTDWTSYNDNGVTSGVAQVVGFNDNPLYTENTVNNRAIVTENVLFNFINRKSVVSDEAMRDYYKDISSITYSDAYDYDMIEAMYYLTHAKVAISNFDEKVNVLDIEPSSLGTTFKNESFWFWYVSKYIGNFSSKVNVTKKSTWEFVGDIDDLNSEYDLIYIGGKLDTSALENAGSYKNAWAQNANKKYYLYSHSGNKYNSVDVKNGGSLGDAGDVIQSFVGSGNDITNKKYKELLEYAKAGYPIVFGRELFNNTAVNNSEITVDSINTAHVDKASYIYDLLKTLINDKDNEYEGVFFENQYAASNAKKFREALEIKKFSISMKEQPLEYVDKTSTTGNQKAYINETDSPGVFSDNKTLRYRFTVNSNTSKTYSLKLYVDTNADGRYVKEEELDSMEIYDTNTKRYVRYNKLTGGHTYEVTRVIDEYVGAIPWKLEVIDNSNRLVRSNVKGMCAIGVNAENKTNLKILQILSNHNNSYNDNNLYFPTQEDIARAIEKNTVNGVFTPISTGNWDTYFDNCIQKVSGDGKTNSYLKRTANSSETNSIIANTGMFYYYLSNLNEFNVSFVTMTVAEFEEEIKNYSGESDYLKENKFNMLVLGYADAFSDVNTQACEAINKFINEGNTTLFTHDTTSFFNLKKCEKCSSSWNKNCCEYAKNGVSAVYWGYNINQYFRNILGMDRYDVMNNKGDVDKLSDDSCDDKPYMTGHEKSENKIETESGKALTQGMTNFVLNGKSGSNTTDEVTKTNDGQILSYPYHIPDSFEVANTHSQYYQLDLEEDDIVVWYSLNSDTQGDYKMYNDVRNNYYIYNKGNITYTGVGHGPGMTKNEVKLFANTLIAAYNATVQATEPVITNSDKSTDNNKTDYVYVDYDATVSENDAVPFGEGVYGDMSVKKYGGDSINTTTKRIYFTLKNNSIVMNKTMTVHYFPAIYDDATGEFKQLSKFPLPLKTYRIENDSVKDKRSDTELPQTDQNTITVAEGIFADNDSTSPVSLTGGVVESNWEYFVDVPITDAYYDNIKYDNGSKTFKALDKENEFAIQIQVIMRYGRDQSANVPLKGYRNVLLMRRGMFSLD